MQFKLSNNGNTCTIMERHCYASGFFIHYADVDRIEKTQREEKKLFSKKVFYYLKLDYIPIGEKLLKTVVIEYTPNETAIADDVFNYIYNFVVDRKKSDEIQKKKPYLKKEMMCNEIGYELAYMLMF